MNKRQRKKRDKIISNRFKFFNSHIIMGGRQNGKTMLRLAIYKSCYSKEYEPFKRLKKIYLRFFYQ